MLLAAMFLDTRFWIAIAYPLYAVRAAVAGRRRALRRDAHGRARAGSISARYRCSRPKS